MYRPYSKMDVLVEYYNTDGKHLLTSIDRINVWKDLTGDGRYTKLTDQSTGKKVERYLERYDPTKHPALSKSWIGRVDYYLRVS